MVVITSHVQLSQFVLEWRFRLVKSIVIHHAGFSTFSHHTALSLLFSDYTVGWFYRPWQITRWQPIIIKVKNQTGMHQLDFCEHASLETLLVGCMSAC